MSRFLLDVNTLLALLDDTHLVRPDLLTPDRTMDLYLLPSARQQGARLATFDRRVPAEAIRDGVASFALLKV